MTKDIEILERILTSIQEVWGDGDFVIRRSTLDRILKDLKEKDDGTRP